MNRWPGIPEERRLEWQAELRFLSNQKQEIEQRIAELRAILGAIFPEKTA